MRFLHQLPAKWISGDDGTTAVEYAVILALILTAIFGTIGLVGGQSGGMWSHVQAQLQAWGL
jgi:Flp pilus assembly pilin Flp